MEQKQTNANDSGMSLLDILLLFVKKFKIIVVFALIAAILGGLLGGLFLAKRSATYNSTFVISAAPTIGNEELLYALRSGMFNEEILLDENGLPPKEMCDAEEYAKAEKILADYEAARTAAREKQEEFESYYIADIEQKREMLLNEYNRAKAALDTYKSPQAENVVTEDHIEMTKMLETAFLKADKELKDYQNTYYAQAIEKQTTLEKELKLAKKEVLRMRKLAKDALAQVATSWRNNPDTIKMFEKITKYVTYEYLKTAPVTADGTNLLRGDYISIKVSVPAKDKPFIDKLIKGYQLHLCEAVEQHLEEIGDTAKSECIITESAIFTTRIPESLLVEGIKYGVVSGVIAAILVYVVLVLRVMVDDKTKKVETEKQKQDLSNDGK